MTELPRPGVTGPPPPGAWCDDRCLTVAAERDRELYHPWTDATLYFDRFVGEYLGLVEGGSSLDERRAKGLQGMQKSVLETQPVYRSTAAAAISGQPMHNPHGSAGQQSATLADPKQHQNNILAAALQVHLG